MKRFFAKVLFAVFVLSGMAAFAACDKGGEEPLPTEKIEIYLDKSDMTILLGETVSLVADYDYSTIEKLIWSSSDEKVASVSQEGQVTAVSAGTSVIKATLGDSFATCNVTVGYGNYLPVLKFKEDFSSSLNVETGAKIDFSAMVLFNGREYADAEIKYFSSDTEVGAFENAVFDAKGAGRTEIVVIAEWNGFSDVLTRVFEVNVDVGYELVVNDGYLSSVHLYTIDRLEETLYDTESDFKISITSAGNSVPYRVNVEDEGIVAYDAANQVVRAVGRGRTKIFIDFNVAGKDYSYSVDAEVIRPVQTYSAKIEWFSACDGFAKGDIKIADIFEGDEITEAYDGERALTVREGVILGVSTSRNEMTKKTVTVYTEKYGYNLTLEAYSGVIATAADMSIFDLTDKTADVDGYYVLKNDIDYTADALYTVNVHSKRTFKFVGVFDGLGNKMKLKAGAYGIFGAIGSGATIRNAALIADLDKSAAQISVIAENQSASYTNKSKIDNCYIRIEGYYADDAASRGGVALFGTMWAYTEITNSVISYDAPADYYADDTAGEHYDFDFGTLDGEQSYGIIWNSVYGTYLGKTVKEVNGVKVVDDTLNVYNMFRNAFVVSGHKVPLFATKNSTGFLPEIDFRYAMYAENDGQESTDTAFHSVKDGETVSYEGMGAIYKVKGIKRFNTESEMQLDETNDYTKFDVRYWSVKDGALRFKSLT